MDDVDVGRIKRIERKRDLRWGNERKAEAEEGGEFAALAFAITPLGAMSRLSAKASRRTTSTTETPI